MKNFISGVLVGVANIIPGVSGGTIIVILGMFDKLMQSISDVFKLNISKKKRIEAIKFLFTFIIGCGCGLVVFAKVLEFLFAHFEMQTLYCEPKYVFSLDEILEDMPRLKEQIAEPKKFSGKSVTREALIKQIKKLDWGDGSRFVSCQKLSPVLMSTVSFEELILLSPRASSVFVCFAIRPEQLFTSVTLSI